MNEYWQRSKSKSTIDILPSEKREIQTTTFFFGCWPQSVSRSLWEMAILVGLDNPVLSPSPCEAFRLSLSHFSTWTACVDKTRPARHKVLLEFQYQDTIRLQQLNNMRPQQEWPDCSGCSRIAYQNLPMFVPHQRTVSPLNHVLLGKCAAT